MLRVTEDILPLGELKTHISEKIRDVRGHQRPLVITQNGRPAAVLLAPEAYDRLTNSAQVVAAVQEGLDDVANGHVVSHEELGRLLDAKYGPATDDER